MYLNPNEILSSSPGLRGTSYPGKNGVVYLPQPGLRHADHMMNLLPMWKQARA